MNQDRWPHYFEVQAGWLVMMQEDRWGRCIAVRIAKIKDGDLFERFIDACNARYALIAGDAMVERHASTTN